MIYGLLAAGTPVLDTRSSCICIFLFSESSDLKSFMLAVSSSFDGSFLVDVYKFLFELFFKHDVLIASLSNRNFWNSKYEFKGP